MEASLPLVTTVNGTLVAVSAVCRRPGNTEAVLAGIAVSTGVVVVTGTGVDLVEAAGIAVA